MSSKSFQKIKTNLRDGVLGDELMEKLMKSRSSSKYYPLPEASYIQSAESFEQEVKVKRAEDNIHIGGATVITRDGRTPDKSDNTRTTRAGTSFRVTRPRTQQEMIKNIYKNPEENVSKEVNFRRSFMPRLNLNV